MIAGCRDQPGPDTVGFADRLVYFDVFDTNQNQAVTKVVTKILRARKRLIKDGPKDWSLAILVPRKRMTRVISDAFRKPPGKLPKIEYNAAVEVEAAILTDEIIAYLLQSHGEKAMFLGSSI